MSKYKCEFCNKEFTTKTNLNYHKSNTKYCLEKQGKKPSFQCESCKKIVVSDNMLQKHYLKCIYYIKCYYEKIISEKNQHIKELQDKLENIALKAVSYNYIDEDPRVIEIYMDEDDSSHVVDTDATQIIIEEKIINQSLQPLNLGDNYTIEYRDEDGYINVSNLCKAGGKQFPGWNRLEKTKAFLKVLSSSMQIHIDDLIKYKSGSNSERSTWVHPQVAINIAQWISPEFDVKVSGWVYEIMVTGKVDIKNTKTYLQLQQENKDQHIRIKLLENKYLKRHKRTEYKANNVIYILATESSKKNNIYIMGKATNLTNRLSVYNKTEEHEVVFYKECSTPEIMSSVEPVIFNKLEQYRQQANRERFILPEEKDITFFTVVVEKCIKFLEEK